AEKLFGYLQTELAGYKIDKLIPVGFHNTDPEVQKVDIELFAIDKQGKEFPIDITRSNFETAQGRFQSIGIRDITEQKRAAEILRERSERYKNSFEYAAIGMWLGDKDGTIREANPSLCKMIGYSESELIGRNYKEFTHPDDAEISNKYHQKLFSGEIDNYRLVKHYLHKDGHYIWADVSVALVRTKDGIPDYDIVHVIDVTKEKAISEELSYHASHDALTDLVNRREFERRTERLLSNIKLDKLEHALCYMDLDRFKLVNDTCGYVAGDELLRQLSAVLKKAVRKRDTLARLGGDEFGVLMEHCSLDHAHRVSKSLQKEIQDYQFIWEGHSFIVGVSMGLIPITERTDNLTELLKNADAACYVAKDAGGNRIHIYHSEDSRAVRRHGDMQWVERLHKALEEDRFCLYAQSIVPLDRSKSTHYEILLRMKDEQGKIVRPDAFLPAAELYNLMSKIDSFVVEKTFRLLADNPGFCKRVDFCSINLSGQSLAESSFLTFVITQLDESGIEGNKICFEVTETAAISNIAMAMKFISTLKELGCSFALDDFGSGLSSFGYLKNLPVDYLKIDGMFVKNIVDDPIDHAMVKSINEIGHVMGMQTIAEFVENDEIKGMLKEIGVNYAQGYGVDKPQPFDDLIGRSNNVTNIKNTAS
ncbi:MAG: diguanylate cyclase (GGDEF)-like protein/PAS domain S-box-containing protein, partial [Gammaproteobacteria bacterium]